MYSHFDEGHAFKDPFVLSEVNLFVEASLVQKDFPRLFN